MLEVVTMALYSALLAWVLLLGSPYWLWRAARGGAGWGAALVARLGRVPAELRHAVAERRVVWVHAVSVGEVLAATRLIAELQRTLGDGWSIVVSTTTATGQALARKRFATNFAETRDDRGVHGSAGRVFYYPLDFAWAVRAYLRALRPSALVLMESELWPRMLRECRRAGIPVAVVNARVSDRSFVRGVRVRRWWSALLRQVTLFLAQSELDARRLVTLGARAEAVRTAGNLKYDTAAPAQGPVAAWIEEMAGGRPVVIAGSTVSGDGGRCEEELVAAAWHEVRKQTSALLVLAPRHPERFEEAAKYLEGFALVRASSMKMRRSSAPPDVVLLDTIGDLAGVYAIAQVAFIGGSLAPRGGHNPLEACRFGVPVITGGCTRNFRAIYSALAASEAAVTVKAGEQLGAAVLALLADPGAAKAMGERGRRVFEAEQGATARTVDALMEIIPTGAKAERQSEVRA